MSLRVAIPGIIRSWNAATQTVSVQAAISEQIVCNSESFRRKHGANKGFEKLPELQDIPIVWPRSGGYMITFPISVGDECLVIFSDTCIDSWWQDGCPLGEDGEYVSQNAMSERRHDLSDGFALIGPWSQQKLVTAYSENAVQLRTEDGLTYYEIMGGTGGVTQMINIVNATTPGSIVLWDAISYTKIEMLAGKVTISQGLTGSTKVVVENGKVTIDAAEVNLAGSAGLRQLIDERLVSAFNSHQHTGVTVGSGTSGTPLSSLVLNNVATTKTKAL